MVTPAELPYISRTLVPNQREHYVRRQRLVTFLSANLSKKVQVVWAPAGYGKTTLLAGAVRELDVPVCWYSFAPEDNDALIFLRYCFQAIRVECPDFGSNYRPLIRPEPNMQWRTLCGLLISALESDINGHFTFVFDDLHLLDEKEELREVLSLLINGSPAKIHFILAGRVWPGLPGLPRLAASGEVASLDVSDLRFSAPESSQLLTNLSNHSVSVDTAEAIVERTGGWAAGIMLTAFGAKAPDSPRPDQPTDPDLLFDYLSEEVFDNLPPSLKKFLLRTSILREFTSGFCDQLLRTSDSRRNIKRIKDRNLFLEERNGQETSYAYHDLFRVYLERRFQHECGRDYEELNRRAADIYNEVGDDDAAIFHYLQIGEIDRSVEVVKRVSGFYFDQGRWSKLASWLNKIPAHVVDSDPQLLLLTGQVVLRNGDSATSLQQLDKLLLKSNTCDQEIRGNALVAKSTAYRGLGHLDLARKSAEDGLAILKGIADASPNDIAEAHRQLASVLATQGDLDIGKVHFQAALESATKDNLRLLSLILDGLAVACIEQGELDEAAVYLEQARTGWLKLRSEGPLAESLINLALVYYHKGEFDLAFDESSEALRIAESAGYPHVLASALSRQATIQQALGAYEDSLATSSRALEMARGLLNHRLIGESTNNIGDAYRKMGEISKATVLLNQSLLEAEQSGQQYIVAIYHILLGKVYYQEKSDDRAMEHLEAAQHQLEGLKSNRRIAELILYKASIFYRKGQVQEARDHLAEAARHLSDFGDDGFLLADGQEIIDVLRFGAARRVGGDTFNALVAKLTKFPVSDQEVDAPPSEGGDILSFPLLSAFGFGVPRVALDSHHITDGEWRSRKAKELFFFLLCNKRTLGGEELLDALWPEESIGLSNSTLKTSIYRLRQAVFYDCILAEDIGYRINPAVKIQFDVDDFQHHLQLATGTKQGDAARKQHLAKAIEIYDGPFLDGLYSEWCNDFRNELELKFHTALIGLAEYHASRDEFLQAADLLARVVESDPYNEEACLRLIEAYIGANEPLMALQHWTAYAKLCREELGAQISERFSLCHRRILEILPRTPTSV